MAAPTPATYQRQIGKGGLTIWSATWSTTDQMTDTVVIDLSALVDGYVNSLTIERIVAVATAGIHFTLEIDSTTDELVMNWPLGTTGPLDIDFTFNGRVGIQKQTAGATGDLVITTLDAASGDEILLYIFWRCN